jgi:Aspartyl protease
MKHYILIALLAFATSAWGQLNSGRLVSGDAYYEIPFKDTKSEIKLKAKLRGDEYDFMLDSGAPMFISSDMQQKYKFPVLFSGRITDATGNVKTNTIVKVDTVTFGPFVFTDIPCIVIDMKSSLLGCMGVQGNIGSNLLRFLFVRFDRGGQHIGFASSEKTLKMSGSAPRQHMNLTKQSDAEMPVRIDDVLDDTIHFDSGDDAFYEASAGVANKYAALRPGSVIRKGTGSIEMGFAGAEEDRLQYMFKPGMVRFTDRSLSGSRICIAGNDRSRMGRELLDYGILQLNYPDSTYSFEAFPLPYISPAYDYGFRAILSDDQTLEAGCVWQNSAAEKDGMQAGDEIQKIDDIDFTTRTPCDILSQATDLLSNNKDQITVTYRHKKHKPQTVVLKKDPE